MNMAREIEEKQAASRRDFLKKSVVVGAAVWTVPAVTSLPGGRAWAAEYPVCNCDASAFALSVAVLGGSPIIFGAPPGCVLPVGPIVVPPVTVTASIVCGNASSSVDGACSANAGIVQSLNVTVAGSTPVSPPLLTVDAHVLTSQVNADCTNCSLSGSAQLADLKINNTVVNPNLLTCGEDVLNLHLVKFDEEICSGDTLNVNALHIGFPSLANPSIVNIIVAHSAAGASGCGCTACGTA